MIGVRKYTLARTAGGYVWISEDMELRGRYRLEKAAWKLGKETFHSTVFYRDGLPDRFAPVWPDGFIPCTRPAGLESAYVPDGRTEMPSAATAYCVTVDGKDVWGEDLAVRKCEVLAELDRYNTETALEEIDGQPGIQE